jgi:hypothetical protein
MPLSNLSSKGWNDFSASSLIDQNSAGLATTLIALSGLCKISQYIGFHFRAERQCHGRGMPKISYQLVLVCPADMWMSLHIRILIPHIIPEKTRPAHRIGLY